MDRWKFSLIVFWVVFAALVVNWRNLITTYQKPSIPSKVYEESCKIYCKTVESARLKGENLTPEDYHRDMLNLRKLTMSLTKKYLIHLGYNINFPERYAKIFHKPLQDRLCEENNLNAMNKARVKIWQEAGFEGAIEDKITLASFMKFLLWLFKAWFIGCMLSFLLYKYRCQILGKSFKELILLQRWDFVKHIVLWLIGLCFRYPEGTIDTACRYHKEKKEYMLATGKKHLTKQEEQVLWQRAVAPIERFDQGIARAFAYSRIVALISTFIISCGMGKESGLIAGEVKEKKEVTKAVKKEDKLDFSGFLQFKYEYSKGKNAFTIPLAVASLKGNLSKSISWKLEADIANKKLRDVWLYYVLDDWVNVKVGKWFAFFTATPPPNNWYLIEYPKTTSLATIHGVGIVADGDIGPFGYYLGVLNGNGNELGDNNKEKDVYMNLILKPLEGISIGTAYQNGKQPEGVRQKFGSHIKLDIPKLNLKFLSEYMNQKMNESVKSGWYILGAWQPLESLQAVCMFERFSEPQSKQRSLTLGLNYFQNKDLKLQLNYVFSNLGNNLLAKAQVSF